ncbi:MAG: hypothetical protein JOZ75_13420 [Candidatus Dormibacteraeota bacterium]|nr:hypothetical protein [Candidatus Dormibacteraeota bacterium]
MRAAVGGRRKVIATADEKARYVTAAERPALQAILERGGALPAGPALLVLDDVLATLERLHAAGITHGHIRPAIVVVGSEGRSRLEDGIPPPAPGSAASGLLGYVAPEVRGGRPATPPSDVYSATAVFLESLTNLPPLGGVEQARRDVSVPVFARGLLEEGLHPDPRRRPQSAARLRADIAVAGNAFLEDDWRSRGRSWLTAASQAIESGTDLAGAVHSPWAGPRRPERDLPAASDARPPKPLIGARTAAAGAAAAAAFAAAKPDRLERRPRAALTSAHADRSPARVDAAPARVEATPVRTEATAARTPVTAPRGTLRDTFSTRTAAVAAADAPADELASPQTDGADRRRSQRVYAGIALGGAGVLALGLVAALVLHGTPATLPPAPSAPAVTTPSPSPTPSAPVFGFSQQFNTPPPTATPSPSPTPTPSAGRPCSREPGPRPAPRRPPSPRRVRLPPWGAS